MSTTSNEDRSGRQFCVFLVVLCVCAVVITLIVLTVMRQKTMSRHKESAAATDHEMMHRLSYEVLKRTKQGINALEDDPPEKVPSAGQSRLEPIPNAGKSKE